MKTRFVLVNPWIYDFAAFSLWARPLGLLLVAEYLSRFDADIRLIDCTDIFTEKRHGMGHYPREIVPKPEVLRQFPRYFARYGMGTDEFRNRLREQLPCDIFFVTSVMSYWYPGVCQAVEIIRDLSPGTPIVLGGIYATLYHDHAVKNSGVDHVFPGHADKRLDAMITGSGAVLKETARASLFHELDLYRRYPFAPLLTSTGCPFRCSYCASSRMFSSFVQRPVTDVMKYIREMYNRGVRDFAFYDDALLVNADSHLKPLLREVAGSGMGLRFHCPNGIHARFIDDELAYLMKQAGFTTIRLGLETVSRQRQNMTGGKVSSEDLEHAVRSLKDSGFTKQEIGVYLMYGLPSQDLEEVKEGVAYLKDRGVRVHLTEFSPVPGTSSWEELKMQGIISDDIDPLMTNNTVFSYLFSGYDPDAVNRLKLDVKEYNRSV